MKINVISEFKWVFAALLTEHKPFSHISLFYCCTITKETVYGENSVMDVGCAKVFSYSDNS